MILKDLVALTGVEPVFYQALWNLQVTVKPGITLLMNLTHFSRFVQSLYAAGRIRDGIQWSTAQQNRSGLGVFSALPKTQAVLAAVIHTSVSAPRGERDEGERS